MRQMNVNAREARVYSIEAQLETNDGVQWRIVRYNHPKYPFILQRKAPDWREFKYHKPFESLGRAIDFVSDWEKAG